MYGNFFSLRCDVMAKLVNVFHCDDVMDQYVKSNGPVLGKIELSWARQVAESPSNRYSFVCSAMLAVCREVDNDR